MHAEFVGNRLSSIAKRAREQRDGYTGAARLIGNGRSHDAGTRQHYTSRVSNVTVVLWRHAPTPANTAGQLQGQSDTDPGADGLALGRVAARRLLDMYGTPAAVYSSPLRRAVATAELLGQPVDLEPGVNQRSYGIWEGMSIEQVAREYPVELAVRDAGGDPDIPGWETSDQVGRRVAGAIEARCATALSQIGSGTLLGDEPAPSVFGSPSQGGSLLAAASKNPGATGATNAAQKSPVLVFASHGSAIATGLRRLLGLPEEPQIFGYLHHANWVELQQINGTWRVERYDYGVS